MSLAKYSDTTDSGIEWLGEVPLHWSVVRLRRVAELNPSKSEVSDLDRELSVSFLPMEAVGDDGTIQLEHTRSIGAVENGYTYFREGDVTLAKITPCFENGKGAIMRGLLNGIGFGTTELIVVRPRPKHTTSGYLHWLFMSSHFRHIGESTMYGAGGQKRVPGDFVRNFATAIPPLNEQRAIASFLDVETSKIDGLVSEQRRLIELLKEKRQAVISHAVTKGLNPNAPLKPSGIQWLGDVPQHWEIACLKHYASTVNGFGFSSSDFQDDGVPFIRAGNIKNKTISPPEIFLPQEVVATYERVVLMAGDIVISMVGSDPKVTESAVGQVGIIPDSLAGAVPNQNVVILRENPDFIEKRYLFYTLCSTAYRNHLNVFSHKLANQSIISSSLLVAAKFAFPAIEEQREIIDYLDSTVAVSNRLLAEAERAIELLQERRTALISAAVTGKIDVRGFASKGKE
ncbi:MAG: restriction endonuclease subunit S [Pirellula sp.]|jgi:type I restriction enzyme S subunit